ncbi:type IV toxin-antitoxin system AbiEi family antitoxin domain-containing protein [Kribbella sp. NPDC049174]|uniref:type IV toxin-antitoxin system AbiEi family antitoxin domain-containing protein n=1 Tax=Kribbella sp. NPDC049174 TaxID=3364112 RepID=UPI00371C27CE
MRWNGARSGFKELRRLHLGAFSRGQANAYGVSDRTLAVRCRSGLIQRLYRGVYVDFSGPVPWETRVWAAWLAYGPEAALGGETALRRYGLVGQWGDDVIRLEIPHERRVRRQVGVVLTRCRDFDSRVAGSREPPIVRLEVAVLAVASRLPRREGAIALVLDTCRQRRTTPQRLLAELDRLQRLPRRALLVEVLEDAAEGIESFLELSYLRKVERAHGLPAAVRQVRASNGRGIVYRDLEYEDYGLIVELDGRAGHDDTGSRWRDMSRDNAALMAAKPTLRFGYQLVGDPCAAAAQVARVLRALGWRDLPTPCTPTCSVLSTLADLGSAAHAI